MVARKHLFLSYCHDNKEEVAKLRDELIEAEEHVWWDQDILPGQDWKGAIREAMEQSYAFVLCLSTLVSGNSGGFQLSQAVGQGCEAPLPTSMSLHTLG